MHKKLLLLLSLLAALATGSPAQTNNFQTPVAVKHSVGSDRFDPPGSIKGDEGGAMAAVKASVIVNTSAVELSAFEMINQKRAERGLRQLTWSDELAAIARIHSQNMAEFNFFSHRGLDRTLVSDRADKTGLRKWRAIGENIAFNRGYTDPIGKAVEQWLSSSSHRHNLFDDNWMESAVGVAVTPDGSYYFTQVFLRK